MSTVVNGVKLVDLCKKLRIPAKNGRSRMRRMKLPRGAVVSQPGHWVIRQKFVAMVSRELRTDHRKRA